MTLTEKVRREFGADNIRVQNGIVQVYWFRDSKGIWVSAGGGPITSLAARGSVARLVTKIHGNRERLPMLIAGNTVQMGEMSPDGNFSVHFNYRMPKHA